MKVRGTVVCTFTRYKHLLLSPARSCAPADRIILSPVCSAAGFVVHGRRARGPLAAHTTDEAALFVGCCAHPSLISRASEAKTRTYFAACRLRVVCVVLFLVAREFTSARWAAIVNLHLGAPRDLLHGERKDELEIEETGLSAFPQKLGFSGKKVLCDEWLSYFCLIDLT